MGTIFTISLFKSVQDYFSLCKPKVILVMLITTLIGMHLAVQGTVPWNIMTLALIGIACCGGSAAVVNHLIDRHIDAKMTRTQLRPIASGRIKPKAALLFSCTLGIFGLLILAVWVNVLTAFLTFLTVMGYAVFYTLYLKRATPQNIVIGGAAGSMPPLLGWTSIANEISAYSLLLALIIFTWTPPHFWALAIYRRKEYEKANIPMLPVTHGVQFTKMNIVLYTVLLVITSILPYVTGMNGLFYFILALILGGLFLTQTLILFKTDSEIFALKTFSFSIVYLLLLFASLLIDHYIYTHYT